MLFYINWPFLVFKKFVYVFIYMQTLKCYYTITEISASYLLELQMFIQWREKNMEAKWTK